MDLEFISNNIESFLKKASKNELIKTLRHASNIYYNYADKVQLSDKNFDKIQAHLSARFGYVPPIGHSVPSGKHKTRLPKFMPSLDKIKAESNDIDKWLSKYNKKGSFVVSDKLDGMSLLLYKTKDRLRAVTRGNGVTGQDISWITQHLKLGKIPNNSIYVRGELIVSKQHWVQIKKRYKDYSNSRNFVSAYTNKKNTNTNILRLFDFIAFELHVDGKLLTPSSQMKQLMNMGFKTAYTTTHNVLSNTSLCAMLTNRISKGLYEVDGLVIAFDTKEENKNKNPKHKKAFKMTTSSCITEVISVNWHTSMHGLLKPVIQLEPFEIDNVTIKQVTGYNAKYICDHKIGPGTKLRITRSGGVIPKIIEIVSSTKEMFPKKFKWGPSHVDIMLPMTEKDDTVHIKRIEHFMKTVRVSKLKKGIITKLYKHGINSIQKILTLTYHDLIRLDIDGIKDKTANNIIQSIRKALDNISLDKVMAGSSVFGSGLGERKSLLICQQIPNLMRLSEEKLKNKLMNVRGFNAISVDKIMDSWKKFKLFVSTLPVDVKNNTVAPAKVDNISKICVCSGFRPTKEMKEKAQQHGWVFTDRITDNGVNCLIVKDPNKITSKIKKARDKKIDILTLEDTILKK